MHPSDWLKVQEDGFSLPPGQALSDLTEELVGWLGSTDPLKRDKIAYSTLATWLERGLYGDDALQAMGSRMVRNLSLGLGERGTDGVFLRAFSVLILGEIVAADAVRSSLPRALVRAWRAESERYLLEERDERGFVPGRGWAHAAAHTADCLGAFAAHPATGEQELQSIMHAIADRVLRQDAEVFIFDEDERLAYAMFRTMCRAEVSEGMIGAWLGRFNAPAGSGTWQEATGEAGGARTYLNVKSFLRSLHFQLLWAADPPPLHDGAGQMILHTLRAIAPWLTWLPTLDPAPLRAPLT